MEVHFNSSHPNFLGLKEGTGTVSSRVLIPKDLFHPSFDTVVIVDSYWAATLVKSKSHSYRSTNFQK